MAINKSAKKETKEEAKKYDIKVTRAKELQNCIMFDMEVNGVVIYGCSYRELNRKDGSGSFVKINFPQRKGSDDKYYNYAYFKITDDMIPEIEKQIEAVL